MRRDSTHKTCSLLGASDLMVIAPIKRGLVPSLDAMTYKTRVKRVLRTLHLSRTLAHENELARVLSDAVERVGRIHSVRIVVLEARDQVLLAVTFDGAWESYVRVIWQKVARLLDLVFCNTEGYVLGGESSYEAWGDWLRSAQAKTSFLYSTPGLTVDDTHYLRMEERLLRRTAHADVDLVRLAVSSAEETADSLYKEGVDPGNAGYGEPLSVDVAGRPAFRQSLRTLAGLHRLIDVYPAVTDDGRVLRNAAKELLPELVRMVRDSGSTYEPGILRARERFDEAMRWFESVVHDPVPVAHTPPPLPASPAYPNLADIQGGIIESYKDVSHGCLLLLSFDNAAALAAVLDPAVLSITSAANSAPTGIIVNIAFTLEGLRLAGLSDAEIEALPEEFVRGMERRAGLLGDVRSNHPLRWSLPAVNWSLGVTAPDIARDDPQPRLSLGAVHAVLQLRLPIATAAASGATPPRQLLMTELQRLKGLVPGLRPQSIQWMERFTQAGHVVEHFNYVDGDSQPVFEKSKAGTRYENHVHLGEVLRGHANAADHAPMQAPAPGSVQELLLNGSFLVLRKLRQDVEAFEEVLGRAVDDASKSSNRGVAAMGPDDYRAKMMGRWPLGSAKVGEPLARFDPGNLNDFRFRSDANGAQCPFHAHIRRANPRWTPPPDLTEQMGDGSRPARLFRRSMPYGPRHVPSPGDPAASQDSLNKERGLVFMVYNADIGEQFEVVQRWLSGGNSSGAYSGESDPFLGVAESGRPRYFRFEEGGETVRVALDGSDRLHEEQRPLVRLEWGMYLFAPSLPTLRKLKARAAAPKKGISWHAVQGERLIDRLREVESREGPVAGALAWKASLEDGEAAAEFETASIFAAVREHHHGVLRTPFGVLAASRELVDEVLLDANDRLSAEGYWPRMERSFGGIYLGQDARTDGRYEAESAACNAAIMALDDNDTFLTARQVTQDAMAALVADAIRHATDDEEPRWELTLEARELLDKLLGAFCEAWFGLDERDGLFRKHGYRRDWQSPEPPDYPGHFMAPSRYFFQPCPGAEVVRVGSEHGVALERAMRVYLARFGAGIKAKVTRAVLNSPVAATDPGFAARTVAGAIMGFVPTVDGNLRRVLNEWLREDTLGALRARHAGSPAADLTTAKSRLLGPFLQAMQLCAAPELLWRKVRVPHKLGNDPSGKHNVDLRGDDIVVAALISATQQSLSEGNPTLSQAFGGARQHPPTRAHPTHACPGRGAAMAMMLGFLSALVESPLKWRAGPAPLTLSVEGLTGLPLQVPSYLTRAPRRRVWATAVSTKPLLAFGDSWVSDLSWGSLLNSLGGLGYTSPANFCSPGIRLEAMARPRVLGDIEDYLLDAPEAPKALLISGGGNDVTSGLIGLPSASALYRMLLQKPASGTDALNYPEVKSFIDGTLYGHYVTILDRLVGMTSVPIVIHAYDHPIPDGRGPASMVNWLKRIFDEREISDPTMSAGAMKVLIDRLNAMVVKLTLKYPGGRVHHVKLTGELAKHYGNDHKLLWENELHANEKGFDILAAVVDAKLKSLGV